MDFTGEQVVIGKASRRVEAEHLVRYEFVKTQAKGKRILDAACGSGYGSALLGTSAAEVQGIDISEEAITHAKENFESDIVHFTHGTVAHLDFPSEYFDIIVSFETIEHLTPEETEKYLEGIRRVLKRDGVAYISTPNRRVVSPNSSVSLVSQWHTHEYTEAELVGVIEAHGLSVVKIQGQRIIPKFFNIGIIRAIMDAAGKYILRRRVDLYWIPTPPQIVAYDKYHEPRVYFMTVIKGGDAKSA